MKRQGALRRLVPNLLVLALIAPLAACTFTSELGPTGISVSVDTSAFPVLHDGLDLDDCMRVDAANDASEFPNARSTDLRKGFKVEADRLVNSPQELAPLVNTYSFSECRRAVGSMNVGTGDVDGDGRIDVVRGYSVYLNRSTGWVREYLPRRDANAKEPVVALDKSYPRQWSGAPLVVDLSNDGSPEIVILPGSGFSDRPVDVFERRAGRWSEVSRTGIVFPTKARIGGLSVQAGDLDRDGYLDLVISQWLSRSDSDRNRSLGVNTLPIRVYRNLGGDRAGQFTDITASSGIQSLLENRRQPDLYRGWDSVFGSPTMNVHGLVVSDIDADGYTDIFVLADSGAEFLLFNEKGSRFTLAPTPQGKTLMGGAIADVNHDGLMDLFGTQTHGYSHTAYECRAARPCDTSSVGNQLLIQTSPRVFEDQAAKYGVLDSGWGWGAVFADLLNDTEPEIVVANGSDSMSPADEGWLWRLDEMSLFSRAPGENAYRDVAVSSGLRLRVVTGGVATADFDEDGRLDFVVGTTRWLAPVLVKNQSPKVGNWIMVGVEGSGAGATNRDGRGAIVSVLAGGKTQRREIGANSSFMSTGSTHEWFGLGQAEKVDIIVYFPASDTRVILRDLEPGQRIVVKESAASKQP